MPHHRYKLPDLPYAYNALVPTISEEIMRLHHDKHHLAYVNGANAALDKLEKARQTGFAGVDVKAIERDLAFHGSGHTMHSTFWPNMKPQSGGKPEGDWPTRLTLTLENSNRSKNSSVAQLSRSKVQAGEYWPTSLGQTNSSHFRLRNTTT